MPYRVKRRKARRNPRRTLLKLRPRRRNPRRRSSLPRVRHAILMNPRRRRKARRVRSRRRVRRNPSYFAPALRMNPRKRRRRRTRRNPGAIKRVMNQKWLMSVASIGLGIAAGYYTLPAVNALIPAAQREQLRPFMGGINVLAGSLIISMAKGRKAKMLREMGAIIAGTGVYDLLAENIPQLGLAPIPKTNPVISGLLPGVSASYSVGARPVSRQASSIGASYAYAPVAYGASYEAPNAQTAGLGSDDPFAGIWQ